MADPKMPGMEGSRNLEVEKVVGAGKTEKVLLTEEQLSRIERIVRAELNVQPFGQDKDGGPTPQDYLDTVQYNLNHGRPEEWKLSPEDLKFLKESGLFYGA